MRRRYLYSFLAFLVFAAGVTYATHARSVPQPMASYSVKIVLPQGHGSGTHIGGGYILTAAHVVKGQKSVVIKATAGNQRYARVLWVNEDYDIALLLTAPQGIKSAHMSCRTLAVGESVHADGNPLNMEFAASYGKISGGARATEQHKAAYITDMTTVMGMSGGGLFDYKGNLVGVTSAVAIAPLQSGATWVPSLTGFGISVPTSAVCELMGKGVV